jgi:Protein of unknown function (DUF1571)
VDVPVIRCASLVLALATGALTARSPGRIDELRALPEAELGARLRATSADELVALGREGVRRLGTYRATLTKQERVGGEVLAPQTIEMLVQPSPRAVRLEYVSGPKAGRKVVWSETRPKQMLVREGGLLGMMSVWLDIEGGLAHRDTNHRVTELGFGPLLDIMAIDLARGARYGGHQRHDEGFDQAGRYCIVFVAPRAAVGLYAQRTRLCIDARLALPVELEVHDGSGFLERYRYTNVRSIPSVDPAAFQSL